jgi:hypothetical protein
VNTGVPRFGDPRHRSRAMVATIPHPVHRVAQLNGDARGAEEVVANRHRHGGEKGAAFQRFHLRKESRSRPASVALEPPVRCTEQMVDSLAQGNAVHGAILSESLDFRTQTTAAKSTKWGAEPRFSTVPPRPGLGWIETAGSEQQTSEESQWGPRLQGFTAVSPESDDSGDRVTWTTPNAQRITVLYL